MTRVLDVLKELGFRTSSGDPSRLELRFGGLELDAVEAANKFSQPVVAFFGTVATARTRQQLQFELQPSMASPEHALALIGYFLRSVPDADRPPWLDRAQSLQHLLPWSEGRQA